MFIRVLKYIFFNNPQHTFMTEIPRPPGQGYFNHPIPARGTTHPPPIQGCQAPMANPTGVNISVREYRSNPRVSVKWRLPNLSRWRE